jgi:DNA excision repair protein ERCC-3
MFCSDRLTARMSDSEDSSTQSDSSETIVAASDSVDNVSVETVYSVLKSEASPLVNASKLAKYTGLTQSVASDALMSLVEAGVLEQMNLSRDPTVYYPTSLGEIATQERVTVFSQRHEIVVDSPTQYTQAQLAQFATLVDSTKERPAEQLSASADKTVTRRASTRGYLYRIRQEDVWQAPFETLPDLLNAIREVVPRRQPSLEEWISSQWKRAHEFRLYTHPDEYVVLEAGTESLMGNVARQKLDTESLVAPISDTESWVRDGAVATVKRTLFEAGYPVVDDRELDEGNPLECSLSVDLRSYQSSWVEQFLDVRAGVLVAPSGSGKTIAALGAMSEIGGETLILVPSRELARQWRREITTHTTLSDETIGEYHGGVKSIEPVTIATYQTAGMDRHRKLFDSRRWGLIIYDEVHHIPSKVFRRSTTLQGKHRLGLSATPVREDKKESEIFTLVGPPIGIDWSELIEAGHVREPQVEIRYLSWQDDLAQNEWANADGRQKRRLAAENPEKITHISKLLADHASAQVLIFVEWLDQGDAISEKLEIPFINGEMPHRERERIFESFKAGELSTIVVSRVGDEGIDLPNADMAILASGLGGSRRQGAQRVGRTMRPAGSSIAYVLATRGTREEEFAQRQMQHLSEKGIQVTEQII